MKLLTGLVFFSLVLGVRGWFSFLGEAAGGAWDMWRAYSDMREANYINADKYFHARGNYDAAQRGPGGVWAAEKISDAREGIQKLMGHGAEDSLADQAANEWGRSGKGPNFFRPAGLPDKY
ncbi:serum amyloid A-1 protein-like [Microcebus murinus]|uniref:Serum amyloid A protein n=1 Tax=Microcebus murinus TaxID=30608 RepID=A0A8B7HIU7_MICMU|nr:serum amyloid A-1 protein-like isoform X2 [Microcebus murinus]